MVGIQDTSLCDVCGDSGPGMGAAPGKRHEVTPSRDPEYSANWKAPKFLPLYIIQSHCRVVSQLESIYTIEIMKLTFPFHLLEVL